MHRYVARLWVCTLFSRLSVRVCSYTGVPPLLLKSSSRYGFVVTNSKASLCHPQTGQQGITGNGTVVPAVVLPASLHQPWNPSLALSPSFHSSFSPSHVNSQVNMTIATVRKNGQVVGHGNDHGSSTTAAGVSALTPVVKTTRYRLPFLHPLRFCSAIM